MECIQKIRNKSDQIVEYIIQDSQGNTRRMKAKQLKAAIKQKEIDVINLKLTSNNRLIDTKVMTRAKTKSNKKREKEYVTITREMIIKIDCEKELSFMSNIDSNKLDNLIKKAKTLGYKIIRLSSNITALECNKEIKVISNKQIGLDDSKEIIIDEWYEETIGMFENTHFKSIDLTNIDTSRVTNMERMFYDCKAQSLDISSFNTSQVINMYEMFCCCKAQSLDFSNFNTSKVTDMSLMFEYCRAKSLNLSSFDTSQVTDMHSMFSGCKAQSIDFSNFNTSKVTDMSFMFMECRAQSLDLSRFDTSNVTDMGGMFYWCEADYIDIKSFKISSKTGTNDMFYDCKAQIEVTDSRLMSLLKKKE